VTKVPVVEKGLETLRGSKMYQTEQNYGICQISKTEVHPNPRQVREHEGDHQSRVFHQGPYHPVIEQVESR
jgi:hypothetical protein